MKNNLYFCSRKPTEWGGFPPLWLKSHFKKSYFEKSNLFAKKTKNHCYFHFSSRFGFHSFCLGLRVLSLCNHPFDYTTKIQNFLEIRKKKQSYFCTQSDFFSNKKEVCRIYGLQHFGGGQQLLCEHYALVYIGRL